MAIISSYLEEDHRRLEQILAQAADFSGRVKAELYEEFRGALLRHIGIEEKILFPAIRNAGNANSLAAIEQLHLDHGALAALLVPSPTLPIIHALKMILSRHNLIEEGPDGIYRRFEQLPGVNVDDIGARLCATPPVRLNPHLDNDTAMASMRAAVRRAGYSIDL